MQDLNDPRSKGFNYGAPLKSPTDSRYARYVSAADELRLLDDDTLTSESWDLDMAIRDVRHSCTEDEQAAALDRLYRNF